MIDLLLDIADWLTRLSLWLEMRKARRGRRSW